MRTRTRSIVVNPRTISGARIRKEATLYTVTGGSYYGLPLKAAGTYPPVTYTVPAWIAKQTETIQDQGGGGDLTTIKAVDHTKSEPSVIPEVSYYDASLSGTLTTYPTLQDMRQNTNYKNWQGTCTTCSTKPVVYGVADSEYTGKIVPSSISETALAAQLTSKPVDKLALLPSRLVRAIEEWHSTTTAIESRELPELWTMWGKREPLRQGFSSAVNLFGRCKGNPVRSIARMVEGYRAGQLGYAFGIMPTVSDMRNIASLVQNGTKVRKERIRVTIRGGDSARFQSGSNPGSVNSLYYRYDVVEDIGLIRVDGAYAVLKRPMYKNEAFARAVNSLVGVNGAAIIWEVIPFSWAVDMFLAVDDMLDVLWANTQTEYDISYWSSTKSSYQRRVETWRMEEPFSGPTSNQYTFTPNDPFILKWSRYNRVPRAQPRPIDAAHFKASSTGLWNGLLVALGLIPRSYRGLR